MRWFHSLMPRWRHKTPMPEWVRCEDELPAPGEAVPIKIVAMGRWTGDRWELRMPDGWEPLHAKVGEWGR
jgi:hypothetical protein